MEKLFNYENSAVRVVTDENEQLWFAGVDVCNILGYADSHQKIKTLDKDEFRLDRITDGQGKQKETLTVNEFGLYSLILSSSKPEAKQFKRWVTHEVLPAIRRAGRYTPEEQKEYEAELQELADEYNKLQERKFELMQELKQVNKEIKELPSQITYRIKMGKNQLAIKFPEKTEEEN
jgi:anti-repressor protein